MLQIVEKEFSVPRPSVTDGLLACLSEAVGSQITRHEIPLRFVVTRTTPREYQCELAILRGAQRKPSTARSTFEFRRRTHEDTRSFNVVLLVPTGIGAEIGGHAGDGAPVAQLIGAVCDTLVTHPNVGNASDINELPNNSLYVEGSIISRLLMGTVGLEPVRSNRVLVAIDAHKDTLFTDAAVNSVNAARATYGLRCPGVFVVEDRVSMKTTYSSSGTAVGTVENLEALFALLESRRGEYDAVALSSVISVPAAYHMDYFLSNGGMVNPWGGVEAMLTHSVATLFDVPSAHSPMFESKEIANLDPGIVDPRMAAEAVSLTFLQCVLKGLHKSPRVIPTLVETKGAGLLTVKDVSVLVIPYGCMGLPTLAALEQGIPVVAVRENRNVMRNELTELPWAQDQLHVVENYWEAVGVLVALKAGVAPSAVRRPLYKVDVERVPHTSDRQDVEASTPVARVYDFSGNKR